MLFIVLIYTLVFIEFSTCSQCPSRDYCTCSSDLRIVRCDNRRLTNEILLQLNNQLPKATVLLNLSSNSLTSIKSLSNFPSLEILDLTSNQIRSLPSNLFSRFPKLISIYLGHNQLQSYPKSWSTIRQIHLTPISQSYQSQNIYRNERLILNCSSNSKVFWTFNHQYYPSTIISSFSSLIFLSNLHSNHSGLWTCHQVNRTYSISLSVLTNSSPSFCQSIHMNTSKGDFFWPRTAQNHRIELKCPFGSAAWFRNSKESPRAWYTCSSYGQWTNFDNSQCAFQTNLSQIFDYFSLNQTNLLFNLVKYLSKIDVKQIQFDDMILLIDLIDEQQEKYLHQDQIMLIYHLADFLLQIQSNFIPTQQYQLAMIRLRLIIERLLDLTNQSWLFIGKELTAMTFQSPPPSTLCFVPNRSLLTIICDAYHQTESQLVTIEFPSESNHYSLYRVIVYRRAIVFNENQVYPVVYIRSVSKMNSTRIRLTFPDQLEQMSIGVRQFNETFWQRKSSMCQIQRLRKLSISADCQLINNRSLAITSISKSISSQTVFLDNKYPQLIIWISSIICSIVIWISICFYIYMYKFCEISRQIFHCLINYWLNLAIILPLFAFGIQLTQYLFVCQFIAISLQFLCLTTIIWLTLLTYSIWRRCLPEQNLERVTHFYSLAYGLALMICGLNILISREQTMNNQICFLANFTSMLILIIPLIIFVFFLLNFLLFTRSYMKNRSHTNECYISTIFVQFQSIDQLTSILFQLILLIFIFLSALIMYIRPLNSFSLRFEQMIYSHLYGVFVSCLSFYILTFYILLRCRFYSKLKSNEDYFSKQSLSINSIDDNPSLTEPLSFSQRHSSEIEQDTIINENNMYSSERLINITSKYYLCHENIMKTTSVPFLPAETTSQKTIDIEPSTHHSFCERTSKNSINIPIEITSKETQISPLIFSKSFTHCQISSSQAIIRPLPIVRLSLNNSIKLSSTDDEPIGNQSSSNDNEVLFIDEDEERSVSLQTSSCTLSTKKNSQTLSISSTSLFSLTNDVQSKQILLHESSV